VEDFNRRKQCLFVTTQFTSKFSFNISQQLSEQTQLHITQVTIYFSHYIIVERITMIELN